MASDNNNEQKLQGRLRRMDKLCIVTVEVQLNRLRSPQNTEPKTACVQQIGPELWGNSRTGSMRCYYVLSILVIHMINWAKTSLLA